LLPGGPDESGSALAGHHGGSIAWREQSEIEDGLTPAMLYAYIVRSIAFPEQEYLGALAIQT